MQSHAQFTRSCALFALVQAWKAVTLFFGGDPFVNAAGAVSGVIVVAIWLALAAAVMQRRRPYLRVTAPSFSPFATPRLARGYLVRCTAARGCRP